MGSNDDASRCGVGCGMFRLCLGVTWLGCTQAEFTGYKGVPRMRLEFTGDPECSGQAPGWGSVGTLA